LGQLKSVKAIPALVALLEEVEEDDWMMQDLPEVFGMIGPVAVPALAACVTDAERSTFPRAIASHALVKIAETHPATRDECVRVQMAVLEGFERQDPLLNSLVMGDLVDLQAVEAAALMERAFLAGQIDIRHMGDWEDVQISLGLRLARSTPRPRLSWIDEPFYADEASVDRTEPRREKRQAEARKKVKSKQKRKAARRSRRQNRK
jgi:hypothetical protein